MVMSLKEQVAYLRGLSEGLEIDAKSKSGKLLLAIVDTLSVVSDEIEDLYENALDIGDELDAISDDLANVEDFVYDDDDDDDLFFDYDDDDDDCDEGCFCDFCNGADLAIDVVCPACNAEIVFHKSALMREGINCPECDKLLVFDEDEDEYDNEAEDDDIDENVDEGDDAGKDVEKSKKKSDNQI
jgi:hypothetical protein